MGIVALYALSFLLRPSEDVAAPGRARPLTDQLAAERIAIGAVPPVLPPGRLDGTDLTADIRQVDWPLLARLQMPAAPMTHADSLDNTVVRIAGFIVPFDDVAEVVTTFLLVPYAGACVHAPVPPPHQIIQTEMRRDADVPFVWNSPVYVEGVLHVQRVDSPYGTASYWMEGLRVVDYDSKRELRR
jgi:hypothetical protein